MRDTLGVSSFDDPLSPVRELLDALKSEVRANGELAVANGIWVHDGMKLRSEFEAAAASCGARATLVDFHRRGDAARALINEWVDANTKHKIRDLVPPGLLNANTRLVMANAIYFKGRWVSPFPKAHTREGQFFLEQGGATSVPFMRQEVAIPYARTATYEAVQLPYQGNRVSMVIVLPNPGKSLRDVEAVFSPSMLRECLSAMRVCRLHVFLPRFTLTWAADLSRDLVALGMRLAFTVDADFSAINGVAPRDDEALYIGAVLHKAFVDVNEEGTEAAAATVVIMTALGLPPTFRADRPFLFVIIEKQSGAILFVGRVADPRRVL
jgi:serpin B